jgi:hypothetical protein
MADEREPWLRAMVSFSVNGVLPVPTEEKKKDDSTADLLLDRRLACTKGARIMSFLAGIVYGYTLHGHAIRHSGIRVLTGVRNSHQLQRPVARVPDY